MPDEKGDILFGFDASSFMKAIRAMKAGVTDFKNDVSKKMSDSAKSIDKSFGGGDKKKSIMQKENWDGLSTAIVKALSIFEAIKITVRDTVNYLKDGIFNAIPEINQALGISKNIFFKNLLWPLRKELLPLLQKLLDWTRIHRKDFVQWGAIIVSMFKAVKHVILAFIDAISPIFERVRSYLKSIFGDTTKSITETVNLAIFKIVALTDILMIHLKPVAAFISRIFDSITDSVHGFFSAVFKNLKGLDISDLKNVFKELAESIESININGRGLSKIFGEAFSRMIITATAALTELGYALAIDVALLKGDMSKAIDLRHKAGFAAEKFEKSYEAVGRPEGPSGMIQSTAEKYSTSNINIGDIRLMVTEGNAAKAGQSFAEGIFKHGREMQRMRKAFQEESILEGLR